MGDKVRGVIEAMVWDLRAMENKGYFDQEEVKTILRTREDHEYQMNKFTSTPLDLLKAIQYEMELVIQQMSSPNYQPKFYPKNRKIEKILKN